MSWAQDHHTLKYKLEFCAAPNGGRRSLVWSQSDAIDTHSDEFIASSKIKQESETSLYSFLTDDLTVRLLNLPSTPSGHGWWDNAIITDNSYDLFPFHNILCRLSVSHYDGGWSAYEVLFTGMVVDKETDSESGEAVLEVVSAGNALVREPADNVRWVDTSYQHISINRAVRRLLTQKDQWAPPFAPNLECVIMRDTDADGLHYLLLDRADGGDFQYDLSGGHPDYMGGRYTTYAGYCIEMTSGAAAGEIYIIKSHYHWGYPNNYPAWDHRMQATLANPGTADDYPNRAIVVGDTCILTGFCWPYLDSEVDNFDIDSVSGIPSYNGRRVLSIWGAPPEDATSPMHGAVGRVVCTLGDNVWCAAGLKLYRFNITEDQYYEIAHLGYASVGMAYWNKVWYDPYADKICALAQFPLSEDDSTQAIHIFTFDKDEDTTLVVGLYSGHTNPPDVEIADCYTSALHLMGGFVYNTNPGGSPYIRNFGNVYYSGTDSGHVGVRAPFKNSRIYMLDRILPPLELFVVGHSPAGSPWGGTGSTFTWPGCPDGAFEKYVTTPSVWSSFTGFGKTGAYPDAPAPDFNLASCVGGTKLWGYYDKVWAWNYRNEEENWRKWSGFFFFTFNAATHEYALKQWRTDTGVRTFFPFDTNITPTAMWATKDGYVSALYIAVVQHNPPDAGEISNNGHWRQWQLGIWKLPTGGGNDVVWLSDTIFGSYPDDGDNLWERQNDSAWIITGGGGEGGMNGLVCIMQPDTPDQEFTDLKQYHQKYVLLKNANAGFPGGLAANVVAVSHEPWTQFTDDPKNGVCWFSHRGDNTLWYAFDGSVGRASPNPTVPGDKVALDMCVSLKQDGSDIEDDDEVRVFGVSGGEVWDMAGDSSNDWGRHYLWQFAHEFTPRIDFFDVKGKKRFKMLSYIGELTNHMAYYDKLGLFHFKKRVVNSPPDHTWTPADMTTVKRRSLRDELYSSVGVQPYTPTYNLPSTRYQPINVDEDGKVIEEMGFNGDIVVRQIGSTETLRLVLTCVVGNASNEPTASDADALTTTAWTVYCAQSSPNYAENGAGITYPGGAWEPGGFGVEIILTAADEGDQYAFHPGDTIDVYCPGVTADRNADMMHTAVSPASVALWKPLHLPLENTLVTPERAPDLTYRYLDIYSQVSSLVISGKYFDPTLLPLDSVDFTMPRLNLSSMIGFIKRVEHQAGPVGVPQTQVEIREWEEPDAPTKSVIIAPEDFPGEPIGEGGLPGQPMVGGPDDPQIGDWAP